MLRYTIHRSELPTIPSYPIISGIAPICQPKEGVSKMTTYISVQTTENKLTRCDVRAPVRACWNALANATSIEEMKRIIRESAPVNAIESKKIGLMFTSVSNVSGFEFIEQNVNAVTFAVDEVYASIDARVIGEDARTYFVELPSGEIRRLYKASTFFIVRE